MNAYTLEEFEQIQGRQQYPYMGLFQADGKQIVAFNPNSIPVKKRLEEIKLRLTSKQMPDGIYLIKCRSVNKKEAVTDDYPIMKGELDDEDLKEAGKQLTGSSANLSENPAVITYTEVLDLKVQLTKLELENANQAKRIEELEKQVEELEEELEDLEEENETLSEKEETLGDRAQSWVDSLAKIAVPAIEKHFEQKDKEMKLRMIELYNKNGQPVPGQMTNGKPHTSNQQEEQLQGEQIQHAINKIQEFITQFQEDPETYNTMAELYNGSEDLDDFLIKFQEAMGEDMFNQMMTYVNAA